MAKRMNTILDVLESIDLISRVGESATTKKIGQLAGSSFYRTRRMMMDAKERGLVNCYDRRHRVNSTARIWVLTSDGLKIVRAYQSALGSQDWVKKTSRAIHLADHE